MKSKKVKGVLILLSSIALSIIPFLFKDFLKEASSLGLIGLFVIQAITSASFFTATPSFLTVIAGGALYPPMLVALIASLGSALGDMLSFLVGIAGRHLAHHKLKKKLWFRVLNDYFRKYGGWFLLLFAFMPNPFFDTIGIVAGVFAYSPFRFFTLVFVGRFVRFLSLASFGSIF